MIDADRSFYACKYSTFCHRASPAFHMKPLGWRYAGLGPTWTMVTFKTFLQQWLSLQSSPTLEPHPSLRGRQPCLATSSSQSRPRTKLAKAALGDSAKKRGRHKEHHPQEMKLFTRQDGDWCLPPQGMCSVKCHQGFDNESWRYIRLLIGFFLSNLDVTIVSSALTGITDDLQGFEKRSWIITGYLATYTGMIRYDIL